MSTLLWREPVTATDTFALLLAGAVESGAVEPLADWLAENLPPPAEPFPARASLGGYDGQPVP